MKEINKLSTADERQLPDDQHIYTALVPFVIAVSCAIAALIFWLSPLPSQFTAVAFGVLGMILAFDLTVCAWVAIQWLITGKPPELSLSPLIPTREEREFRRALRERTRLNDEEFYRTFYSGSQISQELVVQLRKSLENAFGLDFGGLHPTDNLIVADPELDWADIVFRLKREFGIALTPEMFKGFDGTFQSLVEMVYRLTGDRDHRRAGER